MSTDQARMDFIAAYDQAKAEVVDALGSQHPFVFMWIDEENDKVGSTGMLRTGDEFTCLNALIDRIKDRRDVVTTTDPPE